ncbi:MAG TPA: hypothetical protein VFE84_02350, partial [Patescibacteria group bacterium]|nr:hypothetical protein [Patescibacteria group bacterium]
MAAKIPEGRQPVNAMADRAGFAASGPWPGLRRAAAWRPPQARQGAARRKARPIGHRVDRLAAFGYFGR